MAGTNGELERRTNSPDSLLVAYVARGVDTLLLVGRLDQCGMTKKRPSEDQPLFDFSMNSADLSVQHSAPSPAMQVTLELESNRSAEFIEQSDWHEVPQNVFFAWPANTQLEYCEARDIDSAQYAETPEQIEWYLARAKGYREMRAV